MNEYNVKNKNCRLLIRKFFLFYIFNNIYIYNNILNIYLSLINCYIIVQLKVTTTLYNYISFMFYLYLEKIELIFKLNILFLNEYLYKFKFL